MGATLRGNSVTVEARRVAQESMPRRSINLVPLGRCVSPSKCPKRCLPILDPVCGSDGQRYLNHCRMQETNCGKNIVVMPKTFCS